jgi:uncharacterized membrane protein YbhN (UPF0104 family)
MNIMAGISGVSDLLKSERGVFCIFALLCATVLAAFQQLTTDQWLEFTKWLTAFLVASKTVTTAVETFALKKPQIPKAETVTPEPQGPPQG